MHSPPRPDTLVQITALCAEDLPQVMRIQAQCYTAIEPESAAAMDAKRQASPGTCLAAWQGDALIGYLLTLPVRWPVLPALDSTAAGVPTDADTLYLHDLAMSPQARGTGAGSRLVGQALAAARQLRLPWAALVAIQGSAPYWQRHGFQVEPRIGPALQRKLQSYGADAQPMRRQLG